MTYCRIYKPRNSQILNTCPPYIFLGDQPIKGNLLHAWIHIYFDVYYHDSEYKIVEQ